MLLVFVQLDLLSELVEGAVHPAADVARAPGVLEDFGVLALLPPDDGGKHLDAGSLGQGQHLVDDLVHRLLADLLAADGAMGRAHPGPEQAEIVVDLGDGAHGGARVLAGGFLVDGDGGGQALDVVYIGLLHLAQEHPGIGAQRLHIPALALGVQRLEGERRLARAGQAGEHHQLVPGDGDIDIFEVIFPGALDENMVLHGVSSFLSHIIDEAIVLRRLIPPR